MSIRQPNRAQAHVDKQQQHQAHPESVSMHEGIADWCDCCVCEAEPYWAEVAADLGISLSDYETKHR